MAAPSIVLTSSEYLHAQVEQVTFTTVNNSQQILTTWHPVDTHPLDRVILVNSFSLPQIMKNHSNLVAEDKISSPRIFSSKSLSMEFMPKDFLFHGNSFFMFIHED